MQDIEQIAQINNAFIEKMRRRTQERVNDLSIEYNRYLELLPNYPHYRKHKKWVEELLDVNIAILEVIGNGQAN